MELAVLNTQGNKTKRNVTLADTIFGIEPNDHAIYLDIKQIQANGRQGTHKSKERAEVAYSTRKIKKQKGTGGARAGSRKSGTMVGGGRIFGPKPRDYSFKLNKKVKKLARMSALSYKAKGDAILVLENLNMETPKTKEFTSMLNGLKVASDKTLFIVSEYKPGVYLSSRNIQNAKVITASDINTYDILNAKKLIIEEGAVEKIEQLFN
jgi:large subunit ribosomal protein L4